MATEGSSPAGSENTHAAAYLCSPRDFSRYARSQPDHIALDGTLWGQGLQCLTTEGLGLSPEDSARGILTLGAPGAGKTQAIVVPLLAAHLQQGHSIVLADPQGELTPHVLRLAAVTGHAVAIHDPTRADGLRFNLAEGLVSAMDALAVATPLIPLMPGDNRFWSDAAVGLLAAGLLRLGAIGPLLSALHEPASLSAALQQTDDDARLLAGAFLAGTRSSEWRTSANIAATLIAALSAWAAGNVREATSTSDFGAGFLVKRPGVVILTCPGRVREALAPYLGAVLCKLILDLDMIGEAAGGALPRTVAVVLDEFGALGRLEGLMTNINLTRKRNIAIIAAAQTVSQLTRLYGTDGAQILLMGLATQIVFGGGDIATASFFSQASGHNPSGRTGRLRPLITSRDLLSPPRGNCAIFTRFVDAERAAQVILFGRLTRFYEHSAWQARLIQARDQPPELLTRPDDARSALSTRNIVVVPAWRALGYSDDQK